MDEYEQNNCPICGLNAKFYKNKNFFNRFIIDCDCCGIFDYANNNNSEYLDLNPNEKTALKTYLYKNKDKNKRNKYIPQLLKSTRTELFSRIIYPKTLLEKFDFIITDFNKNTNNFGDITEIVKFDKIDLTIERKKHKRTCLDYFCNGEQELERILKELEKLNYLEVEMQESSWKVSLTAEGLKYAKTLYNPSNSKQCFVAMWFEDGTKELWNKIKQALEGNPNSDKNSPEYGANYNSLRIDEKEHTNFIPAEIISEIKRSKFIIADLTGNRGGVYYEAGFAEGLGIPVILTCKENELDNVHFDLKQKNILIWTDEDLKTGEFQRKLVARIGEVVGFNE